MALLRPQGIPRLNRDSPQARGLRRWYPLGDSGVRDYAENANSDIVVTGTTLTTTIDGPVRTFAEGDRIVISTGATEGIIGELYKDAGATLSCWFRTTSTGSSDGLMGENQDNGVRGSMYKDSTDVLAGQIYEAGGTQRIVLGTTDITDGAPHLATYVIDMPKTELRIYVDGVLENTQSTFDGTFDATTTNSLIGDFLNTGSFSWIGEIYHCLIHDRALTNYEVQALFDPETRWDLYQTPAFPRVAYSFSQPAAAASAYFRQPAQSPFLRPIGIPVLNRTSPLTRGLVGYFDLGHSGIGAIDLTGNLQGITQDNSSADLTPFNGTLGRGTSFSGDATNDRITLGTIAGAHPLGLAGKVQFSVAVWLRKDDAGDFANPRRIIDKSDAGNAANGWGLFGRSGADEFYFAIDANLGSASGAYPTRLDDGEFHILAAVRQTTGTSGLHWYLDGIEFAATTVASTIPTDTTTISIGNINHTTDRMWQGPILNVGVWDRALTPSEVYGLWSPETRWDLYAPEIQHLVMGGAAVAGGRIMSSLIGAGGLISMGGIIGAGGGLAG